MLNHHVFHYAYNKSDTFSKNKKAHFYTKWAFML